MLYLLCFYMYAHVRAGSSTQRVFFFYRSLDSQTPTFNAAPVIPAALDAVRRGVEVTLYLDIGFNDAVSGTPSLRIRILLVGKF